MDSILPLLVVRRTADGKACTGFAHSILLCGHAALTLKTQVPKIYK